MTDSFSVVAVRYGTLETTLADAYYRWSAYGSWPYGEMYVTE